MTRPADPGAGATLALFNRPPAGPVARGIPMDDPQDPQDPKPKHPLHHRYRLTRISWRDLFVVVLPTLAFVIGAFALAARYLSPAPPTRFVLASGADGSSFRNYAEQYRKILARSGITVEIRPTQGSVENLQLLTQPNSQVDVAFVQGGMPADLKTDAVDSLGSVFYTPLVVFYWGAPIDRLSKLEGKRLALGRNGSGSRELSLAILKQNGIEPGGKTTLQSFDGDDAQKAVLEHKVDAVFLSGDSAPPEVIRKLLHTKGLRVFNFDQADAYVRRMRFLSRIDLPMGSFDLGDNLPEHPITLVAPTVELVARVGLHPALSDLLIEAAQEVHGHATLIQTAGEFPSPVEHDFPISEEAARYYKSGKTFAYRHLPFWLASLADRIIVLLVPTLVVLVPTARLLPALYRWRVRSRIFRRYAQLIAVERESQHLKGAEQAKEMLARVDIIERGVINLKLPASFSGEVYVLRQHIDFVRARLTSVAGAATAVTQAASAAAATAPVTG
jgi:TRAP-type uncharacterized transport system substrate-binding protein